MFNRVERPERSGREVSGHSVRGAPHGSRSNASGYGNREGDRVITDRGSGAQVNAYEILFSLSLYKTVFREKGREGREKHQLVLRIHAFIGGFLYVPHWGLNP